MGFFGAEVKLWQEDNFIISPIAIDEEYKSTPESSNKNFYKEQADSGVDIANKVVELVNQYNYMVVKKNFE